MSNFVHTCGVCKTSFSDQADLFRHRGTQACAIALFGQKYAATVATAEPFIPDGPPELVNGILWTPEIKRLYVQTNMAARFSNQSGFEQAEKALLSVAPGLGVACAYSIPSDVAQLCRHPAANPNWLAYTFLPPENFNQVEFEVDTTKRCTRCDKEWCEDLDKYYGRVAWLADLCADCRRKA